jgi:hypothetical protein
LTGYLLSTWALEQLLLTPKDRQACYHAWFEARDPDADQLFISAVSPGELLADAEKSDDPIIRQAWRDEITNTIPRDFGHRILPFDLQTSMNWVSFRLYAPSGCNPLPEQETMAIATANVHGLIYVAPANVVLTHLKIKTVDPCQSGP